MQTRLWILIILTGFLSLIAKAVSITMLDGIFYIIFTVGMSSFFALPILAGMFKSFFGRELTIGSSRIIIQADSVPDLVDATVVTLDAINFAGLRHSVYEADLVTNVIVEWIARKKIGEGIIGIIEERRTKIESHSEFLKWMRKHLPRKYLP